MTTIISSRVDHNPSLHTPLFIPSSQKILNRKKLLLDRHINYSKLPSSYSRNTKKENVLLEYAEDFRRQYVTVFPTRRPLLLVPQNELGVRKFLSSTIHPSLLPYNTCYDLRECSEFVSDYMKYLPLDNPLKLSDLVASTSTMLQVREGDCMDMSIFLVSLLRGSGYNAYVVIGYAPQWITEANQSEVVCPLIPEREEKLRVEKEEKIKKEEEEKRRNKYQTISQPTHVSAYRTARVNEKKEAAEKIIADEEAAQRKIREKITDPLHGDRIHVWVLVTHGRRDITEELFIEPTTGTIYPVGKSPYFAIDAVFNEQNYWVNVQMNHNTQKLLPINEMQWDLTQSSQWEYVLIDERKYRDSNAARRDIFSSATGGGGNTNGGGGGGSGANNASANTTAAPSSGVASSASAVNFEAVNDDQESSSNGAAANGNGNGVSTTATSTTNTNNNTSSSTTVVRELAPEDTFDDRDILDSPISWTSSILISRDSYLARYPSGYKQIQYRDCTVEKWSPYYKGRVGLVQKVCIYKGARDEKLMKAVGMNIGGTIIAIPQSQQPQPQPQQSSQPTLLECYELFQHRKDKLISRQTFPLENRTIACYSPGLISGLKSYSWITNDSRSYTFYPGARVDGMISRHEQIGKKITEEYSERDDLLWYRSIAVDTQRVNGGVGAGSTGGGVLRGTTSNPISSSTSTTNQKLTTLPMGPYSQEYPIRKLTEKYSRNTKIPAEADIAKRTHFLLDNTIRLDYHYGTHHITHSVHLLDKNDKLEQSETEGRQLNSVGSLLRIDGTWIERTRGEEQQMVSKLLFLEKDLKLKLKLREESMIRETIKLDEELNDAAGKIILEKSLYEEAYEMVARGGAGNTNGNNESKTQDGDELSGGAGGGRKSINAGGGGNTAASTLSSSLICDYLNPFLLQYPNYLQKPLTRRQALQAKEECLASLKERLLERANIIQQHLDEETQKLHQRQSLFKRQAGSGAIEASEEFNKFSTQCLFRIDILNARRVRHEELALKKYVEMDAKLDQDPRLAALHQQE